jgi:hypothetical protein
MIEFVIEGRGLESAFREMERSDAIRVLGPHITTRERGNDVETMRITVQVAVDNPREARDLILSYLPPDGRYRVRPSLT